jgi:hypothetical protein
MVSYRSSIVNAQAFQNDTLPSSDYHLPIILNFAIGSLFFDHPHRGNYYTTIKKG